MPSKKAKEPKPAKEPQAIPKAWEPALLAAPIEEVHWRPAIYFTVGEKIENELFLDALAAAINVPLRKLFSIISWEGTMKQVVEFGNPKGKRPSDLPVFYEVTEVAWEMLAKGEELSLLLLCEIVKFQILCIKQKDLQKKGYDTKVIVEEEPIAASANKKKADKKTPSKGKGKAERKSPEPPVSRRNTKLLKRGEVEVIDRCINDEPDDGPQRYIIIQGFQNLQLLLMLGELGIDISAVIMISYEKDESFLKQDVTESEKEPSETPQATAVEEENQQKEEADKGLEKFWKYLEPVLNSGKPGSKLFDIARLQYTVKEAILPQDWDNYDMKLEFGALIFEDIASIIYDCEDWKRQHRNYLQNIKLITVPGVSKSDDAHAVSTPVDRNRSATAELATSTEKGTSALIDMRFYNDLMSLVPLECLSVPLILYCVLEQVIATKESLTPPSESIPVPRQDGLDQILVDYMISTVLGLAMSEEEKQKIIEEFKEPSQKQLSNSSRHTLFQENSIDQIFSDEEISYQISKNPEPQEDVQKPVLEKEQQIIIEELNKTEQKGSHDEPKQPLLLNLHDALTWRTHHLKTLQGFDPGKAEQEMMKKLPLEKLLNFTRPSPKVDARRLASIQELMYHCTNENMTRYEVEKAFKQFVFESIKLTTVKENGELEKKKDMLAESLETSYIPWDDPVAFTKEMKQLITVKKTRKQSNSAFAENIFTKISNREESYPFGFDSNRSKANSVAGENSIEPFCAVHFKDTSEMIDKKNRKGSSTDADDEKDKAYDINIDIKYIQKSQLRSLMEWSFAEQHDPFVLLQVLQEAVPFYRCLDTYYYKQDNSVLLVLHNPMNKQCQCNESWETALHSNIGFRNYLEHVAYTISDWIDEEEVKYQAELAAKELETVKLPKLPSDVFPESISSGSDKQRKGKPPANKSRMSISRQPTKSEIEEEDEKINGSFMREGSLKAWKKDQDKMKEEEQRKQDKKVKKDRPISKKKEEAVHQSDSKSSRLSKKPTKQDSQIIKENQESISEAEPEVQETAERTEKFYQFTGYNFGNDLIRVSGEVKSLFPADGGHIQVKIIQFLHGSTIIQVCVMKDKHRFLTYIKDPIKHLDHSEEVSSEKGCEKSDTEEERAQVSISKCRSFSAVLDDGITITLNKYPLTKEQKKDQKDPVLVDILKIPSIHVVTPVPAASPPLTAKSEKSVKNKNSHSAKGKPKKEFGSVHALEEPEQLKEEQKMEIEESEPTAPSEDVPEHSAFLSLNACSPDGLLITFFTEDSIGIKNEDIPEDRILLRQSYPIKTHGSQPCEAARKWPAMQEASRVITLQGTVVKYMMDGSSEILFADGTVSRSPDSGPISTPPSNIAASNQPNLVDQESKHEKDLKKSSSEGENMKGKYSHGGNSISIISEHPIIQTQPSNIVPGTWITTTPIGLTIATKGTEKLDIKPILVYKATDPGTGEIMITRQDKVVTVFGSDSTIVEHADGTRITTFFEDITKTDYALQDETEEIPHDKTRHIKYIKVECVGFATVLMNWEDYTCCAVFGNGTAIIANPEGMYQIFPASCGCLSVDQDGSALYTSKANNDVITHGTISNMELQPAAYFMKSTSPVIFEVLDPEGNHFQVMVNGNTSTLTHDGNQEREEDALLQGLMIEPEVYKKHAPRFFILHTDGSGTELLRSSDVEEYLYNAYFCPTTAVLKEQLPEFPGVFGITFLQPSTEDIGSRWLIKKDVANIIPHNLRSRQWDTFPQVECKIPGPPVGMHPFTLQTEHVDPSSPPVLKCPSVLEVRQLFQYEPINIEIQQGLQNCLKEYIELTLQKEEQKNEMALKEPRNEKELEHAADLLKLVLSSSDEEVCQTEEKESNKVDVASIYEDAVRSTMKSTPETDTCDWTKINLESNKEQKQTSRWPQKLEQYRQELDEVKGTKLALKNMIVPSYFQSDMNKPLDSAQGLDTDNLSESFQISQKIKVPEVFKDLFSASPDRDADISNQSTYPMPVHTRTDTDKRTDNSTQHVISPSQYAIEDVSNRPIYPMPFHGTETDTCNLQSSNNAIQQAVISQCQHSPPDTCNRLLNQTSTCETEAKATYPMRLNVQQPQTMTPSCHSAPTHCLTRSADEQPSEKIYNCCFLHKPLSIPADVLKDIASKNGVMEYRPEELPADGNNIIFNKSLIIDAANQPRREKIKLPAAILSSKPGSQPNQRFTVIEEPVRRKVNTVSIAGPKADGILTKPIRGFELFPRKVNFGVLQEGFTYAYTVELKNVGIDTCRFRVKQPPPSTGLRVCFKPGPVAAGLATELEIELYAIAIGLESTEGAGHVCHHLEIDTEAEELFLPIIATVLTESIYKNRPKDFPQGGKAAGVRLISTDPTSRMDIIRPRKPPAKGSVNTFLLCGS
ncbi:sperm-associated antigen 17 [Chiloscyllium plagiosum]|uniref:sperm-associated antigen 17 n=1 Tax=Chiloscyllium plagiosum TaxID=36176 RepID=UPI001CB81F9C|nr:sperm-associated antigen 17 [Chiloscyllium plagiosum]